VLAVLICKQVKLNSSTTQSTLNTTEQEVSGRVPFSRFLNLMTQKVSKYQHQHETLTPFFAVNKRISREIYVRQLYVHVLFILVTKCPPAFQSGLNQNVLRMRFKGQVAGKIDCD